MRCQDCDGTGRDHWGEDCIPCGGEGRVDDDGLDEVRAMAAHLIATLPGTYPRVVGCVDCSKKITLLRPPEGAVRCPGCGFKAYRQT